MRSLLAILKNIMSKLSSIDSKKTEMELLWTNGSPTSNFGAQSINLALTAYSHIKVLYRPYASVDAIKTVIVPINKTGLMDLVMSNAGITNGANVYAGWRKFATSTTKVTFESGCSYVAASQNQICIPYQIYGIKLGGGTN